MLLGIVPKVYIGGGGSIVIPEKVILVKSIYFFYHLIVPVELNLKYL